MLKDEQFHASFFLAEKTEAQQGQSLREAKRLGFTMKEVNEAGDTLQVRAGYLMRGAKEAGFTIQNVKDAGYPMQQALQMGFTREEYYGRRQFGSLGEGVPAGVTAREEYYGSRRYR